MMHGGTPVPRGRFAALRVGIVLAISAIALGACSRGDRIDTRTKFSESAYGVAASPRVIKRFGKKVPRGGGRAQLGNPYEVKGRWYTPEHDPHYDDTGIASWYGPNFHGRLTANGEIYDMTALSAAHPTLPLPSYVRVTNLANKRSVIVRVNDRGPFAPGRIIDLSDRAAHLLDFQRQGLANVRVQYVGPARMDGRDVRFLERSFRKRHDPDSRLAFTNEDQPETDPGRSAIVHFLTGG